MACCLMTPSYLEMHLEMQARLSGYAYIYSIWWEHMETHLEMQTQLPHL